MVAPRHDHIGLEWRPDRLRRLFDFDFDLSDGMKVEEVQDDGLFVLNAELPGIDPDHDVEITLSDGVLHLSAHRSEHTEHTSKRAYRSEFRYGEMVRDIALPAGAKEQDVTATYKDGILEVRVPLATEEKPEVTRVTVTHAA